MAIRTVYFCRLALIAALSSLSGRWAVSLLSVFAIPFALLSVSADAQSAEPAVVEAIEIEIAEGRAKVSIASTVELGLVGVRVDRDDLLTLQLPKHVPGPAVGDLFPSEGLILAVRNAVEQTSLGPLTRVTIRVREPVAHNLSTDGNHLRLRLWPRDAESEEAALRRQVEVLQAALTNSEQSRVDLAERLQAMETRQQALDASLIATQNEVTEVLRNLRTETEELTAQLRQSSRREGELARQVARLEASLAESEKARGQLEARLKREATVATAEPVVPRPVPTVQLGSVSPESFGSTTIAPTAGPPPVAPPPAVPPPTVPPPAGPPPAGPPPAGPAIPGNDAEETSFATPYYRFIVAGCEGKERQARTLAARLRDQDYASEIYWSDSGYYVVTLDGQLHRDEAQQTLDEAVRRGVVAADAYLARGTSFRSRVDPQ